MVDSGSDFGTVGIGAGWFVVVTRISGRANLAIGIDLAVASRRCYRCNDTDQTCRITWIDASMRSRRILRALYGP